MARARFDRQGLTVAGLWVLAIGLAVVLSLKRYRAAVPAQAGSDFAAYFLPAGELVRQGNSPYLQPGYVYSVIPAAMVALIADTGDPAASWAAINVAAGFVTAFLIAASLWDGLRPWQRPLVFGATAVVLLYSRLTTYMLFLGQVDFLVMAGLALAGLGAVRRWPVTSGVAVAWAGLMKTWPAAIGIWILRRGAPNRWRSVIAAAASVAATLLVTMVAFGPSALSGWVRNVVEQRSQPNLIHYSVIDLGTRLFGHDQTSLAPLLDSPALAAIVNVAAPLGVVALLALCLLYPGDPVVSLWNVAALIVLLLPVSHATYLLYMTPLAVAWGVRVVSGTQRWRTIPITVGWVVWWIITARIQWKGDLLLDIPMSTYLAFLIPSLAMVTWSVIAEAGRHRRGAQEIPEVDVDEPVVASRAHVSATPSPADRRS